MDREDPQVSVETKCWGRDITATDRKGPYVRRNSRTLVIVGSKLRKGDGKLSLGIRVTSLD